MLRSAKIVLLIIFPLLLTACSDPRPQDCKNLVFKWGALIKRMEKSGRFSADFIKQHTIQREMINLLAHLSNKKEAEERKQDCRKYMVIIEEQIKTAKIMDSIAQERLEERFAPPLGARIGKKIQ